MFLKTLELISTFHPYLSSGQLLEIERKMSITKKIPFEKWVKKAFAKKAKILENEKRKFLRDRFLAKLPCEVKRFHAINGSAEPMMECARMGGMIADRDPVVAFIGIGENGHIAFNDPPADFDAKEPYIVVKLDEKCRQQQVGEGWFPDLKSVPKHAISMSVGQILKAERIICAVPDVLKASAVRGAIEEEVHPDIPATILQKHPDCRLFLDQSSASLLTR